MLKSTAIRIAQNNALIAAEKENAAAQREHNQLYKEDIKEKKRHNEFEEETKDRVDVSKKEYLELLEDKKELVCKRAVLDKMFRSLYEAKIPEKVVCDIMNGKFNFNVAVTSKPAAQKSTIMLSFDVDSFDLRY